VAGHEGLITDLRRVAERAQHPGHVLEGRLLGTTFRERTRRLAFEIEDHEVVHDPQDLAQVVVAVDARNLEGEGQILEAAETLRDLPPPAQHQGGMLDHVVGELGDVRLQGVEDLVGARAQTLREAGDLLARHLADAKAAGWVAGGQIPVQLGRALRQRGRGLDVETHDGHRLARQDVTE
jgi:hypothetical protein